MKFKLLLIGMLAFACIPHDLISQVRPDQAIEKTVAEDDDEIYSQTNGILRRIKFSTAKEYFGGNAGIDSIQVLQDSILLVYKDGLAISRDTLGSIGTASNNQTIDVLDFDENFILSISLEGDGQPTKTLDLSTLIPADQQITLVGNDLLLSSNIVPNNSVDLTPFRNDISLSGTELSISGGSTVDLAGIASGGGTDDQTIDVLSLIGTTLQISLENDGQATQTLDLSSLQDGDTQLTEGEVDAFVANNGYLTAESQDISLSGTDLSISGGSTVDLSSLQDGTGTDDQAATEVAFTPTGNIISSDVQSMGEELQTQIDALQTLSGKVNGTTNLGAFTGTIISDDATIKEALQELETEVERLKPEVANITSALTTISTTGGGTYSRFHIIDMTSASTASDVTLSLTSTAFLEGSVHTFYFKNTQGTHNVVFPAFFKKFSDGSAVGTLAIDSDIQYTGFYDGTDFLIQID